MLGIVLIGVGLATMVFACLMSGSDDDDQHGRD